MSDSTFRLPYAVDFALFDRFMDVLHKSGYTPITEFYAKLGDIDPSAKSAVKSFAEFLGLIKSEGGALSLTHAGLEYSQSPQNRGLWLKLNLPLEYREILRWVISQPGGSATAADIVDFLSKRYDSSVSSNIITLAVRTWANLLERANLVVYQKGAQSRIFPTAVAKKNYQEISKNSPVVLNVKRIDHREMPVRLFVGEERFEWNIKSGVDWAVLESAVKAFKENWEKSHSRKSDHQSD